jgi:hypothetical protein
MSRLDIYIYSIDIYGIIYPTVKALTIKPWNRVIFYFSENLSFIQSHLLKKVPYLTNFLDQYGFCGF